MRHPDQLSTHDKALKINLEARKRGTLAEIGAGQEVARWFFHVGGAAATVAKAMSAYDMAMSDAIYGPTARYVSRQRLQAMLDHEWRLLVERLDAERGAEAPFFVFADTVATTSYSRPQEGDGWMGIRFQTAPRSPPSEILIHARMWDRENVRQQEALGILGVNLVFGAFFHAAQPELLIGSLMDDLTRDRMEIDMIKLSGPAFAGVDNRLMSLQLVEQRLTNAALFAPDGEVLEPAEVLHGRPVLIERGSFRPVTRVTQDMLERSLEQLRGEPDLAGKEPVVLLEMTLRNLASLGERIDHADFLGRVDSLRPLGWNVMISNYSRYHNVTTYLRRYTQQPLGMVLGTPTLGRLFEDKHYQDLEGGLLEAFGRLFKGRVRLYVYPWLDRSTGETITVDNFSVPPHLWHLYQHLRDNGLVEPIRNPTPLDASSLPAEVLDRIQAGDDAWEALVPSAVVHVIKERRLFGYRGAARP